jgi:hypothetical protein
MYEIPSRPDVRKCVVNADTIIRGAPPVLLNSSGRAIELSEPVDASA